MYILKNDKICLLNMKSAAIKENLQKFSYIFFKSIQLYKFAFQIMFSAFN